MTPVPGLTYVVCACSPFVVLHDAVEALRRLPIVREILKRRFDRHFEHAAHVNLYRGVFDSFEAAEAAAPSSRPHSYDSAEASEMYDNRLVPQQWDYPAMFWLARALQGSARSIFDLGGHVGIKYYAFKNCIPFPDDLRWVVCDLPAVIRRGARLAGEKGVEKQLFFTDSASDADGADLLYASGSLQYLPFTLDELLSRLKKLPATIVVNVLPLHPSRSFFSLNAIGVAFCPYRVMSERDFLEGVTRHGYRVRDRWKNVGKGMSIPFEEGFNVEAYSGLCLVRN